ncbi:MAG: GntR family transcriptional regulator [Actinomycetota bacterium]|nr:GntR family transcriptional regulator [Actinomycetota bacterium]
MPDAYARLRLEPVTTVDRAAEELRRALFDGELEPGTPLREVALAASLGISRSTVREALGMLVAEGLADRVPNRGTQVRQLDAVAIADVCHARVVVETAGVRSWAAASQESRDAVLTALADYTRLARGRGGTVDLTAAHLNIHRAVAALTESPRLVSVADSLYAEVRLALARVDRTRRNMREQVHTHAALVDLLTSGRLDEAVAELDRHLLGAQASMVETLATSVVGRDAR